MGIGANTPTDECVNVIYFSAATFTTVGYGDIYPVAPVGKAVASVEMMSFFVFFVVLLGNHSAFVKPKEKPKEEPEIKPDAEPEGKQN